jgi:hypothetical protein
MKLAHLLLACLIVSTFISCEESAGDLILPPYQPKLVIDGWIEQGQYAEVTLTKSASYFADIDSAALREALVSTAKVSVSDGETTEVLTLFRNADKFPPYFYRGTKVRGEEGKTYTLTVETRGEIYEAFTSIPTAPKLDSIWFQFDQTSDSLASLWVSFSDEPVIENYYRIFTKQQNKGNKFIPMYLSAIGDKFFDGKSFSFNILKGSENLSDIDNDFYYSIGDTVTVRFCSIDQAHFDFWRTLEREVYSVGNPFSSSGNEVLSNTGEGTLGVWGGYGASYYRAIVKKTP